MYEEGKEIKIPTTAEPTTTTTPAPLSRVTDAPTVVVKPKLDAVSVYEKEGEVSEDEIKELEKTQSQLEDEVKKLEGKLKEAEDNEDVPKEYEGLKKATLIKKINDLKNEIEKLQQENESLKKNDEVLQKLQNENERLILENFRNLCEKLQLENERNGFCVSYPYNTVYHRIRIHVTTILIGYPTS